MNLLFRLLLVSVMAVGLLWACQSAKYTPTTYPERQIAYGSGGGVAGIETTYYLLDNGRVFLRQGRDTTFQAVGKIPNKQCRQLFEEAAQLGLAEVDFQHPGNTYQFLEVGGPAQPHRISWGSNRQQPDERVKALYQQLRSLNQQFQP